MADGRWQIGLRIGAVALVLMVFSGGAAPRAQDAAPGVDARRQTLDEILDLYVRDGLVYYRALKGDRNRLDGYVGALATTAPGVVDGASREEQIAFWLNAYNAIVLQTVIDHYPVVERSREYPARSIRQIPGAFERLTHRVAGRAVTLDQIEQTILPAFHDPRVYLALGRGAAGSGRLRSEAYVAARIEQQLAGDASECLNHAQCVDVDRVGDAVKVSAIFSWREKDFVAAYAEKAAAVFSTRSPIERAVLAFVDPRLLASERELLAKNTFKVEYIPFDWDLNDLTGRGR
jgi:uncharacterized protein DUF547